MDNYLEEDDIDFKKDIKDRIKNIKAEIIKTETELEKLYELDTKQNIKNREIEDYIYYISSL